MAKRRSIATLTVQVVAITFVIKLLGLVKQSVIAAICGATSETDAYFIASGIIMALCSVIFSAVSVSFLSMYTERRIQGGPKSANNLVNAVIRFFVPISVFICLLFLVFAPIFAKVFAPSYKGEQLLVLSKYIRIMSIMFVFSCYTLILNVTLESEKRFLPGKYQNLFQNGFIIIATLFFYKSYGIDALLYAFVIAGIVQCIQITWSARNLYHFEFKIDKETKSIKELFSLIIPLLLGNAMYEINDIVDKQIASGISGGSVSYLTYGASINEIVSTMIIASLSTVLFSHFTTWVAENDLKSIENSLKKSIDVLILIIIPIMIMCIICGDCIVSILYGRGNFDDTAIKYTNHVVFGYCIGFFFQAERSILIRVYYAFQDTKRPMVNGIIAVCSNICMSLLLSRVFGVGGISIATSIAMLLVTILLYPNIKKYLPGFNLRDKYIEYIKMIVAGAIVAVLAYFLRAMLDFSYFFSFIVIGAFVVSSFLALIIILRVNIALSIRDNIKMRIFHNVE